MDSIGDNVMAIICVVVGVLIIGCALVPIVENASTVETETTTMNPVTGINTSTADDGGWFTEVSEASIVSDGSGVTVNGVSISEMNASLRPYLGSPAYLYTNYNTNEIILNASFTGASTVRLASGTVSYADGILTASGTLSDSTTYSKSSSESTLFLSPARIATEADDTAIYGLITSPVKIGEGQRIVSSNGATVIEMDSTDLPSGITLVENDDHTATVAFSSGSWYGPYEWAGYTTTTETTTSDSEYKALYNIIPVLCILGMAYVLIRRFY